MAARKQPKRRPRHAAPSYASVRKALIDGLLSGKVKFGSLAQPCACREGHGTIECEHCFREERCWLTSNAAWYHVGLQRAGTFTALCRKCHEVYMRGYVAAHCRKKKIPIPAHVRAANEVGPFDHLFPANAEWLKANGTAIHASMIEANVNNEVIFVGIAAVPYDKKTGVAAQNEIGVIRVNWELTRASLVFDASDVKRIRLELESMAKDFREGKLDSEWTHLQFRTIPECFTSRFHVVTQAADALFDEHIAKPIRRVKLTA